MNVTRFILFCFPFRYFFAFMHSCLSIHSLVRLQHYSCITLHSQGALLIASILNRIENVRAHIHTYWHTFIHTYLHLHIIRLYLHAHALHT
ncbi:hypothetical protein Hanom_Chr16g01434621 [Helianthus anomalus]